MKKKVPKCKFDGCTENCRRCHIAGKNNRKKDSYDAFCNYHYRKVTIARFLSNTYTSMLRRVNGKATNRPDLYFGKPIVDREVFMVWAKNHPEFLRLYKVWVNCGFDRRFTPTVNRITSQKGYVLNNMEWMTNSQNCGLAGAVRHLNHKKEIYKLLGVTK